MKNFIRRYHNAKKAIAQIRAGEWVPNYNPISDQHLTAYRDGKELWIGSGPFFCEVKRGYFGLFWRHYVWFLAARRLKRVADRGYDTVVPEL